MIVGGKKLPKVSVPFKQRLHSFGEKTYLDPEITARWGMTTQLRICASAQLRVRPQARERV